MTTYTLVTTFNQLGLETYGQRMIDTFQRYWPQEMKLLVFAENCRPSHANNVEVYDIFDASADLTEFVRRHHNNPLAHGLAGPSGLYDERKKFRWDAVRFSYKVFAVSAAQKIQNQDWLIWLDADTYTHSPVPHHWLATVCPESAMCSYLGRGENYHSECGWVAYNLSHPRCASFINDFADMYRKDLIFHEREWHDSYIWDLIRRRYKDECEFFNLNPEPDTKGLAKHPFINSELGRYMDHIKGKRKNQGHSRGKEIVMHRDLPYWRDIAAKGR